MSLFKILICAALVWGGYKYFAQSRALSGQLSAEDKRALEKLGLPTEGAVVVSRTTEVINADDVRSDPNISFVPMPTPAGHSASSVVVFAPAHCTKAEGQRADQMMRQLQANSIPASRASSANFSTDGMTPEGMQNLNSVMAGALPAVFVNGSGKANPSVEEVIAQYKRTKM